MKNQIDTKILEKEREAKKLLAEIVPMTSRREVLDDTAFLRRLDEALENAEDDLCDAKGEPRKLKTKHR